MYAAFLRPGTATGTVHVLCIPLEVSSDSRPDSEDIRSRVSSFFCLGEWGEVLSLIRIRTGHLASTWGNLRGVPSS